MLIRWVGPGTADISGWAFAHGQIAEVPDDRAREFINQGNAELVSRTCPHCGGDLSLGTLEAAALGGPPDRATIPPAKKRG